VRCPRTGRHFSSHLEDLTAAGGFGNPPRWLRLGRVGVRSYSCRRLEEGAHRMAIHPLHLEGTPSFAGAFRRIMFLIRHTPKSAGQPAHLLGAAACLVCLILRRWAGMLEGATCASCCNQQETLKQEPGQKCASVAPPFLQHALPRRISADANGMLDHGFGNQPASPSLGTKSKGPSRLLKVCE